jgi:putative pyruvate formate lyase activating enzyme
VKIIIEALRTEGYTPVFVYNSNGYENVEQITELEKYIDIYLPDFKYADNGLAFKLSKAKDYREIALKAIKEMYRQKGSTLIMNENGYAEKGLIVRHLVLPGYIENSLSVLNDLADISTSIPISLMSQYWPTPSMVNKPDLNRTLREDEYLLVCSELEQLGFYKGWVQELESNTHYRPDFDLINPFS